MEEQLIGCIIKENSLAKDTLLSEKHFSDNNNRLIFKECARLANEDKSIDQVSLLDALFGKISDEAIDKMAKFEFRAKLENFDTYERQIIEKYKERESMNIVKKHLSSGEINRGELIKELNDLEKESKLEDGSVGSVYENMITRLSQTEKDVLGFRTRLRDFDLLADKFSGGELIITAGRPSMGKTAFLIKLVDSAIEDDFVPIVFSLEMLKGQLSGRLVAQKSQINSKKIKYTQLLAENEIDKYNETVNYYYKKEHYIFDQLRTVEEMKVAIRRIASKTDKPIAVFIDYLQLMKSTSNKEREDLRIAEISGELKRIALDYQCPVICLSQLNRGVEQRQDKRPVMSDLRDSGSIEQDADKILLLYRSDYYNRDQEPTNELDVIIAKNREGQVGTATIKFYLETGVMRN